MSVFGIEDVAEVSLADVEGWAQSSWHFHGYPIMEEFYLVGAWYGDCSIGLLCDDGIKFAGTIERDTFDRWYTHLKFWESFSKRFLHQYQEQFEYYRLLGEDEYEFPVDEYDALDFKYEEVIEEYARYKNPEVGLLLIKTWFSDNRMDSEGARPECLFGLDGNLDKEDVGGSDDLQNESNSGVDPSGGILISPDQIRFPEDLADIGSAALMGCSDAVISDYTEALIQLAKKGYPGAALVYGKGLLKDDRWNSKQLEIHVRSGIRLLEIAYQVLGRDLLLRRLRACVRASENE
jgi:hypothetical protein